jgi:hypothetical protein
LRKGAGQPNSAFLIHASSDSFIPPESSVGRMNSVNSRFQRPFRRLTSCNLYPHSCILLD